MAEHKVYVITKDKKCASTRSKKDALKLAKKESAEVYAMPLSIYKNDSGQPGCWDLHTFMLCSERIF
jgi:hypothetical protein